MRSTRWLMLVGVIVLAGTHGEAAAQSFGLELHNTLMPVSGGMAGVSLARPQDLQSAINGNPATLTQFRGTQFSMGGGWVEPTYKINQPVPLPLLGIMPYDAKSNLQGSAVPNIGVTQDLEALGLPVTFGMGLVGNAGAGVDFRGIPQSNGTSADYLALDIIMAAGASVTDRLSLGASLILGSSFLDGPFVGNSAMVPDYALRGSVGAAYEITEATTFGVYWQSKKSFTFDDAISIAGGPFQDIKFDHPRNLGFGIANSSLLDGRLLLASDVLFKQYSDADFFKAIYNDQWVVQVGSQLSPTARTRLRLGYAFAENAMRDIPGTSVGGIVPPSVQYVQAQFAAINEHRLTGGIGFRDLLPGWDFDLFAGGMFDTSDRFSTTTASVASYWLGAGLTWRFGRGSCCESSPPSRWGAGR